ncbi:MAG: hypothetical protein OXU77_17185 [Gammaproteobacteria bacterium]|nr:hypothetical protein [Gammaproteobacteria bacterium]
MQAVEIVAVLGIAALLATTGYRVANERRDAARLSADLNAVAALAAAYQGTTPDCGRTPGRRVEVDDMLAALGDAWHRPTAPAAWSVRFYSRPATVRTSWPPSDSPRITASAFDIVRAPGAPPAAQAMLATLGGRPEGQRMAVAWRLDRSTVHGARRSFAAGRAFTGC